MLNSTFFVVLVAFYFFVDFKVCQAINKYNILPIPVSKDFDNVISKTEITAKAMKISKSKFSFLFKLDLFFLKSLILKKLMMQKIIENIAKIVETGSELITQK